LRKLHLGWPTVPPIASNLREIVQQRPLVSYIVINYAISWTFLLPAYRLILAAHGSFPPLALFGMIGSFGPSIAAVIVLLLTEGRGGVTVAFRGLTRWHVHLGWYGFALCVPIAAYIIAVVAHTNLPADVRAGMVAVPAAFLVALPFGPLGEEFGWRGFLLPKLLRRYDVVTSTVIVGTVWAAWHVASFTFPGAAIPSFSPVGPSSISLFFLRLLAESFIFSYLFIRTGGSLVLAIALHTAFNASPNIVEKLFPALESNTAMRESAHVWQIVTIAMVAAGCFLFDRSVRTEPVN
jgi:membrane protease YdiL (CAAX protease family)